MGSSDGVLSPIALIVPSQIIAGNALTRAPVGSLIMSGAKLYVCVTEGSFEKVTSAV